MPLERLASALQACCPAVVTAVPGFGVTPVWEALGRPPLSHHEEVACGVAHGAALTGVRAASLLKTHGLLKAANQVSSGLSCGVRGGLVHLVFEDPEARHSDNLLEATPLLQALGLPFLRCEGPPEPVLAEAFSRSEEHGLPVAVVVDGRGLSLPGPDPDLPRPASGPLPSPVAPRDPQRHLVGPLFAAYQHEVLQARRSGRPAGSVPRPPLPPLPDTPAIRAMEPFFQAFRLERPDFVAGDTSLSSLYGLPPFGCVDAVTCLGGSLPMALGALAAGLPEAWALAGDFSFLSMGPLALLEAVARELPLKGVVFANGVAAATGGQPVDPRLVELALAPYASRVLRMDPDQPPGPVLAQMRRTAGLQLLVVELAQGSAPQGAP